MKDSDPEKEVFYKLVHSSDCCSDHGWLRQKPGARNFILFSHIDGRVPSTFTFFFCIPIYNSRELDLTQSKL